MLTNMGRRLPAREAALVPRPIRVLHVLDKLGVDGSTIHGVTQALLQWIPDFSPGQYQFTVCSLRAPEKGGEVLQQAGIKTIFLSKSKLDPTTLYSLLHVIRQEHPHVLHLHGFGATTFGRLASLITGIPNIVHEHAILTGQPLYQNLADSLLSSLTTRAVAVSEPVRDYITHDRRIRSDIVEVFHPGTPLAGFSPPGPEVLQATRDEFGIRPEEHVICFVGRLAYEKGVTYLLDAAKLALRAVPDTRLLIVGDGPERAHLQELAEQYAIAAQVTFTGYRSDVLSLIGISDVVAIPSFAEGGPTTFLEAMKMRVPVVGTSVGLMAEGIREGETGFLVPVKSVEPLAQKLIYLLEHLEEAHQMGERSWEVCQQYSLENAVGRLHALYMDLAAQSRQRWHN